MKSMMKLFLSFLLAMSISFSTNTCSTDKTGGLANGLLLGLLVRSQASGTCGISINSSGLWYGHIARYAVLSGVGTFNATTSPYVPGTLTSSTDFVFDMEDYNQVAGETVASGTSSSQWTGLPYNKRYDAFYNTSGSSWNTATDGSTSGAQPVLAVARGKALWGALIGYAYLVCAADSTTSSTALQSAMTSFYNNLDANEQGEVDFFISYSTSNIGFGALGSTSATNRIASATCTNLTSAVYPLDYAHYGHMANGGASSSYTSSATAITAGVAEAVTLYYKRKSAGTAIFACAQIPKTSCSYDSLTTKNRGNDLTDNVKVFNNLVQNSECKNTDNTNSLWGLAFKIFKGLPNNYGILALRESASAPGSSWAFQNYDDNAATASFYGNKILATEGYPKFGTLVDMGFGDLMPVLNQKQNSINSSSTTSPSNYSTFDDTYSGKYCCEKNGDDASNYTFTKGSGATMSYSTSTTKPLFSKGVNLKVTSITESCSSLGLNYGPYPNAPAPMKRLLTPVKEIYYSFSIEGKAAQAYANFSDTSTTSVTGITSPSFAANIAYVQPTYNDAVSCNKSFRKKTEVPEAIGGARPSNLLDELAVPYGDGNATSLISICVYGAGNNASSSDSDPRALLKALLKSALFSSFNALYNGTDLDTTYYSGYNINDCSSSVKSYAQTFGEIGVTTLSGFSN
ncbi:MAG: hypothetical protein H7A23_24300 [Leptospiraceae bacterium]|nr:hypothetical protein [Leptospiraceae bacterium]MCP5497687.1 hypothetical protein [Leptospiraceae bacterium]